MQTDSVRSLKYGYIVHGLIVHAGKHIFLSSYLRFLLLKNKRWLFIIIIIIFILQLPVDIERITVTLFDNHCLLQRMIIKG